MKKENLLLPAKVKKVGLVAKINANLVKNARILREILARYGVQILFENAAAKHLNLKEGSNLQGFGGARAGYGVRFFDLARRRRHDHLALQKRGRDFPIRTRHPRGQAGVFNRYHDE